MHESPGEGIKKSDSCHVQFQSDSSGGSLGLCTFMGISCDLMQVMGTRLGETLGLRLPFNLPELILPFRTCSVFSKQMSGGCVM